MPITRRWQRHLNASHLNAHGTEFLFSKEEEFLILWKLVSKTAKVENNGRCAPIQAENPLCKIMVRTYKKKTKRGEWSIDSMKIAVDKVLSKEMGYKKTASAYAVPQTTLERYVKKMKEGSEVTIGLPLDPKKSIFTSKEEGEIEAYLKYMEKRLFGLTTTELRRLAYHITSLCWRGR
ncbi:hypothetical protein evm_013863 [Chilo suppressalis]|nr:hypothetical protein evm_013863 [Chilo suppressalis]